MSYMKLIKLLYLVDRTALTRWGQPVTFDKFSSTDKGVVLSKTLSLINGEDGEIWQKVFQSHGDHETKLIDESIGIEKLSKAEIKLLDEIFEKFGKMSRWQLSDYHHTLPEWIDPDGSSIPIDIQDVLKFENKTSAEIESIKKELESLSVTSFLFDQK